MAQLLEMGDAGASLSQSLASHGGDLRRAFDALPTIQREAINERWGRNTSAELISLAGESDPELFCEGLISLAARLNNRGQAALAVPVYNAVSTFADSNPWAQRRAHERSEALQGRGSVGAQAEVLLSQFVQQATEPTSLLAMGVAGAAFRVTRLATLGRLVASPSANALTRGFGARALASLAGFGVEATVFPLAGRVMNEGLGHHQDWSRQALGHDLASSFLFLGAMKFSGWAAGAGFNRVHGINPVGQATRLTGFSGISQSLVPQVGMLGGILIGHELEVRAGLRDAEPRSSTWIHSLAMLAQFNVAGRLTRSAFGEGFHAWEQSVDRQTQILSQSAPRAEVRPGFGEGLGGPALAMAGAGGNGHGRGPRLGPDILMMSNNNGESNGAGQGSDIRGDVLRPSSAPSHEARPAPMRTLPPTLDLARATEALDTYRDNRSKNSEDASANADSDSIYRMSQALRFLRENPESARAALIGRTDLSPDQLNEISQTISPVGNRVLTNPNITRVLIPNRGEIAHRIARALHAEGITPVVLVPHVEANANWVQEIRNLGGEARIIEGDTPVNAYKNAYLNIERIVQEAQASGSQAVHPGYGYRSESAEFAGALERNRLILMGPSVISMERAGDKDRAKQAFIDAGVPVVPGTKNGYLDVEGLVSELVEKDMIRNGDLAFPLRLKAVAGGGGRGQRTVHSLAELRAVFPNLSNEAANGFGNGSILAERFMPRFHHVEFQIMADRFGNVVHLGERECTLQERGQKLIEIHPAAIFGRFPGLRERMATASVNAAKAMEYTGHGTVEFMVDPSTGDFYAMEVNARIQVEHRVSESVTGFDLIREAINVSRGLPLSRSQEQIHPTGGAVEIRIKAVNPDRRDKEGNASPSPGLVEEFTVNGSSDFSALAAQGISVETSVQAGDRVSPNADPMIAKIVVTGTDRLNALQRAAEVLQHTTLRGSQGFASDLNRQLALLRTRATQEGTYDNRFVDEWTRLGGEDYASLPNAESTVRYLENGALHVQVGGSRPVNGSSAVLSQAVSELLGGAESGPRLNGPVADLLRANEELRQAFSQGNQGLDRWVQVAAGDNGEGGELRQAVLYQNNRPSRLLLSRSTRLPTGRGNEYDERPGVYDISLNPDSGSVESVGLHFAGVDGSPTTLRIQGGDSYITARPDGSTDIFSNGRSSTPQALNVRLIPAGRSRGIEVRDRSNNLLVSLAPDQLLATPAQRLLNLFESTAASTTPDHVRRRSQAEINNIIRELTALSPESPVRQSAMEELGGTPTSLVRRLLTLAGENRPVEERQLLDEILARREVSGLLRRHRVDSYEPLDANTSLVRFTETSANGTAIPRLMLRIHGPSGQALTETVANATRQLGELQAANPETRDNVIQIVTQNFGPANISGVAEALNVTLNTRQMMGSDPLRLKRLTFVVERNGEYPDYYTLRRQPVEGQRTGIFAEDTRFRNVHPMLAHLIELDRLRDFDVTRDLENSNRQVHIYRASNKQNGAMAAGSDQRLFGNGLISEAQVRRGHDGQIEIPEVEQTFLGVVDGMHGALESKAGRRSYWNRIFLNIQPILPVSDTDVAAYAETLANRHADRLRGLGLEKVVVKGRLRDESAPGGFRTILVRITNPTGVRFQPVIHNVVRANVADQFGAVSNREVLLRNGTYENWLNATNEGNSSYVVPHGEWAPADIPIRPATGAELREQQARSRGATWAYRIPQLIGEVAENFRSEHGVGIERALGSEPPPNPLYPSSFVELELDPTSTPKNPRTQMVDYNQGELIPAVDASGAPRAEGLNQAGVVIGIQTDHLGGTGMPMSRVVIMGDLTHKSRGSLSANECARINAAIRLAAREGIPVDWFTASSGAEIHEQRGVEGLDATAATVREIVQNAHSQGVPINIVVDEVNIGAQSYWNSLASIIHDTGGVLIMTPRGSMALTGPDAWTAAMQRHLHSEDLPAEARRFYPNGLGSLAGYSEVHGPNGEAMAFAPNLAAATEMLLRHHYYSYRHGNGQIVSLRHFGSADAYDRDITREGVTVRPGEAPRTVGDELQRIKSGSAGNREGILEALRDRGSPEPLRWWSDAQGIRHQEGGNGLMPQRFNSLIQEMQIGGRPTMVIFPPAGPLAPADSEIIGRAITKASGRMPVLLLGSLTGFNGDPRSMENRQLFGGATIAESIVNFRGPITVVDLGYIVGGTFVVVSKQLNPNLRLLAMEGSHAQVIGGVSASKVVFRSAIRREADNDPRVIKARQAMEQASEAQRPNATAEHTRIRREVIADIEKNRGEAFDGVHSVERGVEVGAIDEVIQPQNLREAIIRHQRQALDSYEAQRDREAQQRVAASVDTILGGTGDSAFEAMLQGFVRSHGEEGAHGAASDFARSLQNFLDRRSGGGGSGNSGNGGSSDGSNSPP